MDPVRWAEAGGYTIALAGVVAAFTFDAAINVYYLSMTVMVLAVGPIAIAGYQLEGRSVGTPARAAWAAGGLVIVVFAATFLALAAGLVTGDTSRGVEGAYAVFAVAMLVFGLWLVAALILAGPWLTPIHRSLGVVGGLAWAVAGAGLLLGGGSHPLTIVGGIGFQLLFPIWGVLIGRLFAVIRSDPARRSEATGPTEA
jgi:hypothetical protein